VVLEKGKVLQVSSNPRYWTAAGIFLLFPKLYVTAAAFRS
jgi:hypothetical protein